MKPQERPSSKQYAYTQLKQALYERRLAPGTSLTERSICDTFGVGRTPAREALHRLAEEGFVEIIPNRGAFVRTTTKRDFMDYYEVRNELEIMALEKGIDCFDEEDYRYLEGLVAQELEAYAQKNIKEYLDIIEEFYSFIMFKSGNTVILDVFKYIYNRMYILLILYDYFEKNERLDSPEAHSKIIRALRAKDIGALRTIITEHSKRIVDNMEFDKCVTASLQASFSADRLTGA